MDTKHHCNSCPHWYVTQKQYPSGFYDITICRKYGKQIYYLAGDKNRTPYPCSICEKEFSYVPYMEQELLQEVEKMTERLSDRNPCTNCKADRQIGNPNRWECECSRCDKHNNWKNDCVKKLAEYENAEEDGRLYILPHGANVGDCVHAICRFMRDKASTIGINRIMCSEIPMIGRIVSPSHEEIKKVLEKMPKSDSNSESQQLEIKVCRYEKEKT